jgi:hypothetical protein
MPSTTSYILEHSKKMPFFTDMKVIFDGLAIKALQYNWLISDFDVMPIPGILANKESLIIDGAKLRTLFQSQPLQFNWGVFSAFPFETSIHVTENTLPFADGNESFWKEPAIQVHNGQRGMKPR